MVSSRARSLIIAMLAFGLLVTRARAASAFGLEGHEIIEAGAYKRLMALAPVPGTRVSGRSLLQLGDVTGQGFGADVGGRAGIAFDAGKVELAVDSPPMPGRSRPWRHRDHGQGKDEATEIGVPVAERGGEREGSEVARVGVVTRERIEGAGGRGR